MTGTETEPRKRAETQRLVNAYVDAYCGIYGVFTEDMSEAEQETLAMKYLEELFADLYAGIRRGRVNTGNAASVMEDQRAGIDTERENSRVVGKQNAPPEGEINTALAAGKETVFKNPDGTRYSIAATLKSDLEDVIARRFDATKDEVYIGKTSNFLVQELGLSPIDVTMPANKAYSAMATEEEAKRAVKFDENTNYHGLGVQGLMDALTASENPVAAFVDEPDINEKDNKRENRIVLVTDKLHNGKNIAVVMEVDTKGLRAGKQIDANKTITTFDRSRIQYDIERAISDKRILHIDKKRSQTIRGVKGAYSPTAVNQNDFATNIQNFWLGVKWKMENNNGYTSEGHVAESNMMSSWKAALKKKQEITSGAAQRNAEKSQRKFSPSSLPEEKQGVDWKESGETFSVADEEDNGLDWYGKKDTEDDIAGLEEKERGEGAREALGKAAANPERAQKNTADLSYEGKNLAEDESLYHYDFLVKQKDMRITWLPEMEKIRQNGGKIDTATVVTLGLRNAGEVGTMRDGKAYVKNGYTGREIVVTTSAIRHGMNGKFNRMLTNARLGAVVGELVQNAIPVNALKNKADGVAGTYAMAALAKDKRGREIVALLTIEQRSGELSDMELYDVLHAVSGRQKNGSQADTKSQGFYPIKATEISIADFIRIVNTTHQSILSNDVLKRLGESKPADGAYTEQAKFSIEDDLAEFDAEYAWQIAKEDGDAAIAERVVEGETEQARVQRIAKERKELEAWDAKIQTLKSRIKSTERELAVQRETKETLKKNGMLTKDVEEKMDAYIRDVRETLDIDRRALKRKQEKQAEEKKARKKREAEESAAERKASLSQRELRTDLLNLFSVRPGARVEMAASGIFAKNSAKSIQRRFKL